MAVDKELKDGDAVLAVDPGKSKCGIAVVLRSGETVHREVSNIADAVPAILKLLSAHPVKAILIGTGTGSCEQCNALESTTTSIPIIRVIESHTSELARKRYLDEHPPRGLQRLVPRSLRYPDKAYDDYAAVILAERWLREQQW